MNERPRRQLPVDLQELEFAFEFDQPEARYYLNLDTGALLFITDEDRAHIEEYGLDDPNHPTKLPADLEANPDATYVLVPSLPSHEGYTFMRDFIDTVANARLQDALANAINQRKPFRQFRGIIDNYPDELQRWYAYKSSRVQVLVREWLDDLGISPNE